MKRVNFFSTLKGGVFLPNERIFFKPDVLVEFCSPVNPICISIMSLSFISFICFGQISAFLLCTRLYRIFNRVEKWSC